MRATGRFQRKAILVIFRRYLAFGSAYFSFVALASAITYTVPIAPLLNLPLFGLSSG